MRVRFRLSWLILLFILLGVVAIALTELFRMRREVEAARQLLVSSQVDITRAILGAVADQIEEGEWNTVVANLDVMRRTTRTERISLVTYTGAIILDSHGSAPLHEFAPDLPEDAFRQGSSTGWVGGQDNLQVAVRINTNHLDSAAVLIREVQLAKQMAEIRQRQSASMLRAFLVIALYFGLVLLLLWLIVLRPIYRMREAVHLASDDEGAGNFPPRFLMELDDFGRAFTRLIERVRSQRDQLTELNRNLAATVAEQAKAVERANHDLAVRAAGLEAINRIIQTAAGASNHKDLARGALQQIQQATRADFAWVTLNGTTHFLAADGQTCPAADNLIGLLHGSEEAHLLVPDWLSPNLPAGLEGISRNFLECEIRSTASVTIRTAKKAFGCIDLASKEPDFWSKRDFAFIEIIGQQLGVMAERLEDYEASLENSRLMARLAELSGLLNRPLGLAEVIATIGKGVLDLTGAPRAAMLERQPDGDFAILWQQNLPRRLARSLISRSRADRSFFLPENPVTYHLPDVAALPEEKAEWWQLAGAGIRSYSSWPLYFEGQASALVVAFYDRPTAYSQLQAEVLDAFSRQAAIALRNARLLDSEREQRLLAEALRDVASALTSTLDLNEVIERILTNINRVVEHDAANVMLLEGEMLHIVRSRGASLIGLQLSEWREPLKTFKILEQVAQTGRGLAVPDTEQEPLWVKRPESAWIRSYATAPIRSRGRVVGFVNVSSRQPGFFTAAHAAMLQAFADQASIALENANQFQSTRAVAAETNTLLRALAPLFAAGADLGTVAEEIARAVVGEFAQSHCGVLLVDKDRQLLQVFREAGEICLGLHVLPLDGPGLTVAAARLGKTIYCPDVRKDKRYVAGSPATRSELAIPLIAGGEVTGVLNVESPNLDAFNEASRRMLSAFAERAAWVLANAQLFEVTRANARQMTLLNEITQVALSGGDIQTILKDVVRRVAQLINADGCYMTGWEENTRQTIPLMAYGINEETYTSDVPKPGERNLTYALMHEGRPIAISDTYDTPYLPRAVAELFPTRSLLGVPLQVNGSKLGALLVGFNRPYEFTPREIAVIQQAGGLIALILARMNALVAAQARADESERLRQASAALTTTLNVNEVAQSIIEHLETLVQCHTAMVCLYKPDGLQPLAYKNAPAEGSPLGVRDPLEDRLLLDVLNSGGALALEDAQQDPRYRPWDGEDAVRSWLGIPLTAGNEVMGLVTLGRREVKPFNANEILLVQVYSNQAAVALQNALLHAHQQQLAITDPLTGLYNRRGFFELARHELDRSRRFNRPLSLMMIDIDHFKDINDLYGHAVGDDVLREMGRRFRKVMREADLLCRYGGDEFCFLLPETDCRGLCSAAERLLDDAHQQPFSSGELSIWSTFSIGISTLTSGTTALEELIEQADQALYQAKQAGRDRVALWQPA